MTQEEIRKKMLKHEINISKYASKEEKNFFNKLPPKPKLFYQHYPNQIMQTEVYEKRMPEKPKAYKNKIES